MSIKNEVLNKNFYRVIAVLEQVLKKIVYKTIKIKYIDMLFSIL